MADVQIAYVANIELSFNYKANQNSQVVTEPVLSERISYLMIEHLYDNVHILPVLYLSINLPSQLYSKVVNSSQTSTFTLKIYKRNKLSRTAIQEEVVNDIFSYVPSSTTANYSSVVDENGVDPYKNIMIGLVSNRMTNLLRQPFNGIYNNTTIRDMIALGLNGLPNLVYEEPKYDKSYAQLIITPSDTRYGMLSQLFKNAPFYDTNFTFYMDFKRTYFLSREANAIPVGDGRPVSAMINIANYNEQEAYTDGFTITNGAYNININAVDTEVTIDNATEKIVNNIVAFSDNNSYQDLNLAINNAESSDVKTTYLRSYNAAAYKNQLQSNSIIVSLLKQNLDSNIFNPNMRFNINHVDDYKKYNGKYYIYYKREMYTVSSSGDFVVTCNVGLKKAGIEEIALSVEDTANINPLLPSSNTSSSSYLQSQLRSMPASRNSQ